MQRALILMVEFNANATLDSQEMENAVKVLVDGLFSRVP